MSEKKKKYILTAANECFAQFGYKKTTLEDIGKKIGLNKASIYYYFKSKEEIFTTLVINEFHGFISELHQKIEEDIDCEQKIFRYFEQQIRYFQESTVLQQITEIDPEKLQLLISSGKDVLQKIEDGEKAFMAKILKNCIKNGEIKDCNVAKVSEYLFGLVNGIKHGSEAFSTYRKCTPSEIENLLEDIQTALKIFINGLK